MHPLSIELDHATHWRVVALRRGIEIEKDIGVPI